MGRPKKHATEPVEDTEAKRDEDARATASVVILETADVKEVPAARECALVVQPLSDVGIVAETSSALAATTGLSAEEKEGLVNLSGFLESVYQSSNAVGVRRAIQGWRALISNIVSR